MWGSPGKYPISLSQGRGPGQGVLGIPYTQSVALGWGSPIGGLWNLIVSSSSARIHTPGMAGAWAYGGI